MNKYDTIGPRILALIIDTIILSPILFLPVIVATISSSGRSWIADASYLISYLLIAFYYIGLHARNGQTVGKHLCDVQVLTKSADKINLQQAIIRYSPYLVQILLIVFIQSAYRAPEQAFNRLYLESVVHVTQYLYFGWIAANVVTALFSPEHRALHDYLAGTVVVKE